MARRAASLLRTSPAVLAASAPAALSLWAGGNRSSTATPARKKDRLRCWQHDGGGVAIASLPHSARSTSSQALSCETIDGVSRGPALRTPYPPLEPLEVGMLPTADGKHEIYYEVSGNPNGKPAVFLHGGPGGGSDPGKRRLFDPSVYRIVLFDQRGGGKSTPSGSIEENTPGKLVEDIELLRETLKIDKWGVVVGGSWGSTLAVAYAARYPERVASLVLYSIFVPSKAAIEWPYVPYGVAKFLPQEWEEFVNGLPPTERDDVIGNYADRLLSDDTATCLAARTSYLKWIMSMMAVVPNKDLIAEVAAHPEEASGLGIEMYYMANGCFLDGTQWLDDCWRIAHLPCSIVHGCNDLLCPPGGAWELRKRLPLAKLTMVPLAGHSSSAAPQLRSAIIEAIDGFRA